MFAAIAEVAHRRECDVLLARTVFHPETLGPVTCDAALWADGEVVSLNGIFCRDLDATLWIVPKAVRFARNRLCVTAR